MKSPYDILDVSRNASWEEIRKAYRLAAKNNHPDRHYNYYQKIVATEKMFVLNEAYSILQDFERTNRKHIPPDEQNVRYSFNSEPRNNTIHTSFWVDNWLIILYGISSTSLFLWFLFGSGFSESIITIIIAAFYSFYVFPQLFTIILASFGFIIYILISGIKIGFSDKKHYLRTSVFRTTLDIILRLIGLLLIGQVWYYYFQSDFVSDIITIFLIYISGFFIGEIIAMAYYFIRSRIINNITNLLLLDANK